MDEAPADAGDGSEAGTTLVELLVAMALLSFVALLATQGLRSVRSMIPVAARMDGAGEVAAVRGHIARTIEEAMAGLALGVPAAFEGRPDKMRFLAPSDPILEVGGIADIRLATEVAKDGGTGLDLVERRALARDAGRGEGGGERAAGGDDAGGGGSGSGTVLLSNVASLTLAYRTSDGEWKPDWPKDAGLPTLVSVEIAFPPGDARRFRRLLVHPASSPLVGATPAPAPTQVPPPTAAPSQR